ncbi:MAG: dihydrolipoyl dehydrogenase [Clostridia bacterium]|nr:dihydrolipoyl dehydrogenase [Clostridia bacterium]
MYDLIVIGGGPAGYLAAERAGAAGLNTLLIEKRFIGGVCLNEGCVPSKALLYSAKLYDGAAHGDKYGITVENIKLDHAKVVARKRKVVDTLVGGIKAGLKAHKVTVVDGVAHIEKRTGSEFKVSVGDTVYEGARLLIACGSEAAMPPIPGVKENFEKGFVLTNREILDLEAVPERLVVIGGGVIGLEMASYFNSAGSKVTVIEMMNKIAGPTDGDISKILQKNYEKKGITFLLGAKVVEVTDKGVKYDLGGKVELVEADKVLLSIGRRPSTAGLGLENIGVEMNRGAILTDEQGRTNVAGVFASGDCNGKMMLAHVAYRESEVAINTIMGKKDRMRYTAVPSVIYTNPEVAFVGLTEEQAKAEGMDVAVVNTTMKYSGRYVAENEGGDGICKLVIDKKNNRLVGVHMIGNYSSEIIISAVTMLETEMRIEDIKEIIFPHPTVCEIIREGLFQYK